MTSSATLNEGSYNETSGNRKAKDHVQTDLMIEGGREKGPHTLDGRRIAPDHVFNILFLGAPAVGKSQIINRVWQSNPHIRIFVNA